MFYLSPCNSFYILGLCSLASIQSQPRDTGLYQAHMCALLHLTHISSFVTVTKLACLSWEMCRLWLTVHVWSLYFESHADLSNTGSVKASFTLLSSTGTMESCRRFAAPTADLWFTLYSVYVHLYVCVCVWGNQRMNRLLSVLLELNFRSVLLACSLFPLVGKIWGGKAKWNIFHARVLARLPEKEKKGARRVYPNQISH